MLIIFSSFVTTYALESGVTGFSITPIRPDFKDKFVYVNLTAPQTRANSKILVSFFTDGVLTRITPLDISSKTGFANQKINTYVTIKDPLGNYFLDQTPDEIKIFTWDQNNLVPKTLCDNVLTHEVIDAANANVVESLALIPEATKLIRETRLITEEEYLAGTAEEWDNYIWNIMDYLDSCAEKCLEDSREHLITSLYDLDQVRALANEAPTRQKNKLKTLMEENNTTEIKEEDRINGIGIPKKYFDAMNNAMKFLDFSLTK